uniref:Uncharacterized protein n=1 Tax=Macrostomum lignano TaxID=282301 RepID=A0A1I8FFG3_9PLAT
MHGVLMHGDSNPDHKHRHSQADQAVLKARRPATECGRRVATFSEDEGLLGRWWRTLKYLVTGSGDSDSGKGGSRPTSAADFNLMQDLWQPWQHKDPVAAAWTRPLAHSHRDTDKRAPGKGQAGARQHRVHVSTDAYSGTRPTCSSFSILNRNCCQNVVGL